jgi:basic amino acid/polyamine antiporter, APA family
MSEPTKDQFKASLSLTDATMIVAGSMIGSGIFIVSADITRNVGSAGWLIMTWVLAAVLTITAALSYGELSSMYPKAGGQYTYIKEAFGPLTGFLYGWTLFTVIQTGTIAAVGVAFAKFTAYFFPIFELKDINAADINVLLDLGFTKVQPAHAISIAIVLLLTYINTRGVDGGKMIQTLFTITKITALLALIILGFALGFNKGVWNNNWTNAWAMTSSIDKGMTYQITTGLSVFSAMSAAMVGSVFSADAWNNITFIAGEVKNPKKNIGLSLLLGTGIVLTIYILTNFMYTGVLSMQEIGSASSDRVAIVVCQKIFGDMGTRVLAALIMISTFGCVNGMILSGSRVIYTMANDNMFFKSAGSLNKNSVPAKALWMQCLWTCLLCLSGKYGDLLDYVVIAVLIFYIITLLGIFKLRKTQPNLERPYKAVGYPFVPILYIGMATLLSILLLVYKTKMTLPGLLIVLIGVPVYYLFIKKRN